MSNPFHKGLCGCRFVVPINPEHTNQLSEDWDQLMKWVEPDVLLLGWNENLQPHEPFVKWVRQEWSKWFFWWEKTILSRLHLAYTVTWAGCASYLLKPNPCCLCRLWCGPWRLNDEPLYAQHRSSNTISLKSQVTREKKWWMMAWLIRTYEISYSITVDIIWNQAVFLPCTWNTEAALSHYEDTA